MARNLHVVPHEDGWAIKREGEDGTVSVHGSQEDAVEQGERLAAEGEVNLVVHRDNGAFDHVESFREGNGRAAASSGRDRADYRTSDARPGGEPVRLHDVASVGSRVSWGALLAGAVVALTVYVALGVLGVAVGLSTAEVAEVDGGALAIGTAVWAALSLLISLFLGGFVTSRSTVGERKDESMIYGLLLWGTIFVSVVVLTGLGLNLGVGGMIEQVTGSGAAAPILNDAQIAEAGLSAEQVETLRQFRAETDAVRTTTAAWWTFATLIASIIASIAGALVGAGPQLSLEDLRSRREAAIAARA